MAQWLTAEVAVSAAVVRWETAAVLVAAAVAALVAGMAVKPRVL